MTLQESYLNHLQHLDRDGALKTIIEGLDDKSLSVDEAFDLISIALSLTVGEDHDIWQEHGKTQIVRSSLEILSPYIFKAVPNTNGKRVAIVCPAGEYHELGARIVSEVIRKEGYVSLFFGNSMPNHEIIKLVKESNIDAIAFSISNFYSLSALNVVIDEINNEKPNLPILLGGMAIAHNSHQIHGKNLHFCLTMNQLKESLRLV